MDKAKHTPGPWCISRLNKLAVMHRDTVLAFLPTNATWNGVIDDAEASANARLIASAPDLLARLRETTAALANWSNILLRRMQDDRPLTELERVIEHNAGLLVEDNAASISRAEGAGE